MPVLINKEVSQTPREVVDSYRAAHPEYYSTPIGYAGRLDPMASGLLLLLVGDENKSRASYEALEKEYEFEVLFGLASDSYDLMGIFTNTVNELPSVSAADMKAALNALSGVRRQAYPPYSSAAVFGKPLYWWTRQGRLGEITIPTKEVTISILELKELKQVPVLHVASTAINRVEAVHGDFRQETIIEQWRIVAKRQTHLYYPLAVCRVVCSSGTYVRGLVNDLGRALSVPALTYSIRRTRIGPYTLPAKC